MPTSDSPAISVVIPVANEAARSSRLPRADHSAARRDHLWSMPRAMTTLARWRKPLGCRVVSSSAAPSRPADEPRRRRRRAAGSCFFCTRIPGCLPARLRKLSTRSIAAARSGGGFARRYRSSSAHSRDHRRLAGLRNRLLGWHLGDQAIFVRRDIFDRLGGYRDIPIFEDLDFSRRLRALGKTVTLTPPVYSSARRFAEKGPLRTTWDDLRLTRRYLSGADPNELCLPGVHRIKATANYERLS